MEHTNAFPRTHSLKQKRLFDAIFSKSNRQYAGPLMLAWKAMPLPETVPIQIAFSVPKKRVKKAADRNKIKRRLREAYRLQNQSLHRLLIEKNIQLAMVVVLTNANNTSYEVLRDKMMLLLRSVEEQLGHGK